MKKCKTCGKTIPARVIVGDKVVNTQRRKFCYDCSPFGSGNNTLLKGNKSEDEKEQILSKRRSKRSKIVAKYQKKLRRERKQELVTLLGGKCTRCGYSKCYRALEFHHKDKKNKRFSLSSLGYTCSWDRLIKEAKKCELICANCHREVEEDLD